MQPVQFEVMVGEDQVIRPPAGVVLPCGAVEVTVRPLAATPAEGDPLAATRAWMLELAAEAERCAGDLPADLAERHDFYAHGKPRP